MKRIALIILSVVTIIAGSVSCQKVNDLDKRLTELEQTVSDLKAQILAGAVITSVDKTADGCTFTLSNGQSYTVTNGKDGTDGTDGEAIIADIKIEGDFVVLTLKDGEIMRISYQNPLSMVTLNIVPDYNDGTVREPVANVDIEEMGTKNPDFSLRIAVTPANYAEILSDTERFIHKAVFLPVQTKGESGNAFTASPISVAYTTDANITLLEASFDFDYATVVLLQNNPAYTVSYSIEDKDGVHGAATAFIAISHEKGSEPGIPSDYVTLAPVDLGLSVRWANMNLGASSPTGYGDYYAWGATEPFYSVSSDGQIIWNKEGGYSWQNAPFNGGSSEFNSSYFSEHKSEFMDENNVLLPEFDAAHKKLGGGWRMPTEEEFDELLDNTTIDGDQYTTTFTSKINGKSITFPMQHYYDGREISGYIFEVGSRMYNESSSSYYLSSTYKNTKYSNCLYMHYYWIYCYYDTEWRTQSYTHHFLVGQDLRYGLPIRPVYDDSGFIKE